MSGVLDSRPVARVNGRVPVAQEVVSVAICTPQQVVFEGLVTMLGRHPDKARVVPLPRSAEDPGPDLVLFDVITLLEGRTGVLRRLLEHPGCKVLAIGHDLRPDLLTRALNAGVDGFFPIGVDEKELLEAVESAATGWHEGDPGLDPTVGSADSEARASRLGADVGLTGRETEIVGMIARGLSNRDIASQLYLSPNSVKSYIRTAYRKMGVERRSAAVAWAIRHGFE